MTGLLTGGGDSFVSRLVGGLMGGVEGFAADFARAVSDPITLATLAGGGGSIADVLERFATGLLYRSTIEDLIQVHGTLKAAYEDAETRAKIVDFNGEPALELELKGENQSTYLWKDPDSTDVYRLQSQDRILEGEIAFRPDGSAYVVSGTSTERHPNGTVTFIVYENNEVIQMQIVGDSTHIDIYGIEDNPVTFYNDGTIKEGVVENLTLGKKTVLTEETIRIENIEISAAPFGSNGTLDFSFNSAGNIVQYETYNRTTGELIGEGLNLIKDRSGSFVGITPSGRQSNPITQVVAPSQETLDLFALQVLEEGFAHVLAGSVPEEGEILLQELGQYFDSNEEMVGFMREFDGALGRDERLSVIQDWFQLTVKEQVEDGINQSQGRTGTVPTLKFILFEKEFEGIQTPEGKSETKTKAYMYSQGEKFLSGESIEGEVSVEVSSGIGTGTPGVGVQTKFKFNAADGIVRTLGEIPVLSGVVDELTGTVSGCRDDGGAGTGVCEGVGTNIEVSGTFDLGHRFTLGLNGAVTFDDDITSALATVGSEQTSEIGVTLEKHDGTTAFIPIKLSSAVDMDVFGEGASLTISLSNIPIFQDGQSTHLGVDFSVEVSRSTGDDGERQSLDQKINNFLDEFDKLMAQVGGGSLLPVPGQTVLRDALKTEVESVLLTRDALDKIATDLAQAVSYSGPDFSGDLSGIENLLKGDVLDGVRLIP